MHREAERKGQLLTVSDGTLSESDARAMLERIRWPNGPHCVFADCGGAEVYRIEVKGKTLKSGRVVGPRHLLKCKACRRQFSVTKGTIFEDSKIPLRMWILVMYRMCSSKKGVSAHQIHREFGLSYESAWFMCHRVRYAMADKNPTKLSGVIEADETYVGGKPRGHAEHRRKRREGNPEPISRFANKAAVFGIKERGGRVRARVMDSPSREQVEREVFHNVDRENAQLMTDEHIIYRKIKDLLPHQIIRHKSEYVRGEVHTQSIESFWAVLKRGLIGTYHHVDAGYLGQYVNEFQFRHNSRKIKDGERFTSLLGNVEGRLDWYVGRSAKPSSSGAG
ncbi:MAG: IS1595 family transposase [Dehalococcoidia bacterium]